MSRVIKGAIVHGDKPKILESPVFPAGSARGSAEQTLDDQQVAAACAAIIEAHNQKAAACLAAAEEQRNTILAQAQAQADQMLKEAAEKAEELKESAQQEGYQRGLAEGKKSAREEIETQMQQKICAANQKAQHTIQLAEEDQKEALINAERQMIEIAMAIAEKIVSDDFSSHKEAVIDLVKKALEKVKNQSSITIKVADEDYERVLEARHSLQAQLDGQDKLTIVSDPLVGQGGCLIESESGTVDARLKTQFEALKKAMREVM